jgi:hypothetical protein
VESGVVPSPCWAPIGRWQSWVATEANTQNSLCRKPYLCVFWNTRLGSLRSVQIYRHCAVDAHRPSRLGHAELCLIAYLVGARQSLCTWHLRAAVVIDSQPTRGGTNSVRLTEVLRLDIEDRSPSPLWPPVPCTMSTSRDSPRKGYSIVDERDRSRKQANMYYLSARGTRLLLTWSVLVEFIYRSQAIGRQVVGRVFSVSRVNETNGKRGPLH